jgi:hypothetical protein
VREQQSTSSLTFSPETLHSIEIVTTIATPSASVQPKESIIHFESESIQPSIEAAMTLIEDMPFERTWFAFDWFSDFFKNITEAASSENLLSRTPHSIEGLSNSCKPVTDDDISALHIRIRFLPKSDLLPQDFHLPSKRQINRFLSGYFGYFSPHTPVVHVQSFDFSTFSRTPLAYLTDFSPCFIIDPGNWCHLLK